MAESVNIFRKLYGNNATTYTGSGYVCQGQQYDELGSYFSVEKGEVKVMDSADNVLTSISLDKIGAGGGVGVHEGSSTHGGSVTQYNSNSVILQPHSTLLLQGTDYGLNKQESFYYIPEKCASVLNFDAWCDIVFDLEYVDNFEPIVKHIDTSKVRDNRDSFIKTANKILKGLGLNITMNFVTKEFDEDADEVSGLYIRVTANEGNMFSVFNMRIRPIYMDEENPDSPFVKKVISNEDIQNAIMFVKPFPYQVLHTQNMPEINEFTRETIKKFWDDYGFINGFTNENIVGKKPFYYAQKDLKRVFDFTDYQDFENKDDEFDPWTGERKCEHYNTVENVDVHHHHYDKKVTVDPWTCETYRKPFNYKDKTWENHIGEYHAFEKMPDFTNHIGYKFDCKLFHFIKNNLEDGLRNTGKYDYSGYYYMDNYTFIDKWGNKRKKLLIYNPDDISEIYRTIIKLTHVYDINSGMEPEVFGCEEVKSLRVEPLLYPNGACRAMFICPEYAEGYVDKMKPLMINHVQDVIEYYNEVPLSEVFKQTIKDEHVLHNLLHEIKNDNPQVYQKFYLKVLCSYASQEERKRIKNSAKIQQIVTGSTCENTDGLFTGGKSLNAVALAGNFYQDWVTSNHTESDEAGNEWVVNDGKIPTTYSKVAEGAHIGQYGYLEWVSKNNLWTNFVTLYAICGGIDNVNEKRMVPSAFIHNPNDIPIKLKYLIIS